MGSIPALRLERKTDHIHRQDKKGDAPLVFGGLIVGARDDSKDKIRSKTQR